MRRMNKNFHRGIEAIMFLRAKKRPHFFDGLRKSVVFLSGVLRAMGFNGRIIMRNGSHEGLP